MYFFINEIVHKKGFWEWAVDVSTVAIGITAIIALSFAIRNLKLQKVSAQMNLFNYLNSRADELLGRLEKHEGDRTIFWEAQSFNFYELFSYYANHKLINKDMIEHFAEHIPRECDRVSSNPLILLKFKDNKVNWTELKKFYKRHFKKEEDGLPLVLHLPDISKDEIIEKTTNEKSSTP